MMNGTERRPVIRLQGSASEEYETHSIERDTMWRIDARGHGMAERTEEQQIEEWLPDLEQVIVSTVGLLSIGALYLVLGDSIRFGPPWLLLLVEGLLIAPLFISHGIMRRPLPHRVVRGLAYGVLTIVVAALIISLARFLIALPNYQKGVRLLVDGALLWTINVLVFTTAYWEVDGGGPRMRRVTPDWQQDFMFPQQQFSNPGQWEPGFIDYLFLAFCFSTALSPADSFPLTHRTKLMVMVQALISLVIIGTIVGRAVNIL